jgi:hypothetical protein
MEQPTVQHGSGEQPPVFASPVNIFHQADLHDGFVET